MSYFFKTDLEFTCSFYSFKNVKLMQDACLAK